MPACRCAARCRNAAQRLPRYAAGMRLTLLTFLLAAPAFADNGHTGTATPRTAPELSDLALFVMAVAAVWFVRRRLRARHRRRGES